jgi:hypothetical protein
MTIKTERRKKVRNRPRSLVYVELEAANGGMMRDLSEEGFALRAMMPLRAGNKTQFAFSLDGTRRISGEGRIVWIKEDGRVAGIEFCGIPLSAREEIREWLGGVNRPAAEEHRPAALDASEASTLEELRREARRTLAQVATPKAKAVEAAPAREPEVAPTPVAKVTPPEERREEVQSGPPKIAVPLAKPVEAAPAREPEVAPTPVAKVTPPEERREGIHIGPPRMAVPLVKPVEAAPAREPEVAPTPVAKVIPPEERGEEVHASLPRMAIPSVKPAETVPEVVTERISIPVPEGTLREEPQEETRFTLPRVSLASVGSEVDAEVKEVPAESVVVPSLEVESGLQDVSEEVAPLAVLEPLPAESRLEPLPELADESEFSERIEEPLWRRFTLTRAIGIMVVLTLIAAAVVGHRQVGHALIWLGEVIAGDEGATPSHSSTSEPSTPVSPIPERASQAPLPPAPVSSALPSPQKDGGAPAAAEPEAPSAAMGAPPTEPVLSPAVTKTPSVPALQPVIQQSRVPQSASSTGASADSGQLEYQEAERILKDQMRGSEIPAAVRLLWAAVEKGNMNAEVALADLYRRGRGVTRNCTQARVLLSAAAQKGSGEARKELDELAREGCE